MVKKILPFLCSLAPLYAFGAAEDIGPIPTNPDNIQIGANQYGVINSGTGVNVAGVVTLGGDLFVSAETSATPPILSNGNLYIIEPAGNASHVFGITSGGTIAISGDVDVSTGRGLQLGGEIESPIAISIGGEVRANGSFNILNATSFTVNGEVSSSTELSISAGTINTGMVSSTNGTTTISATSSMGSLQIGGVAVSGTAGNTSISSATTITSGDIQNLAVSGVMTITSHGSFSVSGNVENSGGGLTINTNGGAMVVNGTLKNDSENDPTAETADGKMSITAASLWVKGGDENHASFVNSGYSTLNIAGQTKFDNGVNIADMVAGNSLTITTGSLVWGQNVIANNASAVNITVTSDVLDVGDISNGVDDAVLSNNSANMTLKGVGIDATSVQNFGNNLTIQTYSSTSADDITITGGVTGAANSLTTIGAYDALTIGSPLVVGSGIVANDGEMHLSGNNITMTGVTNSGTLTITAPTDASGNITVNGTVTNVTGSTTITSKNMTLGDVENTAGTLDITGSGTSNIALSVGAITVDSGILSLNAWAGGVASTGNLSIDGGVLSLGGAIHSFVSSGDIEIAGNVNLANTPDAVVGNGDVYLNSTDNVLIKSSKANGKIDIDGNIVATTARSATFDATNIYVNNVNVQNGSYITFGSSLTTSTLGVENALNATNSGIIEIYSGTSSAASLNENGKFIMHGDSFTATAGTIVLNNGLWFGGTTPTPSNGMLIVKNTANPSFTLQNNTATGGNISVLGDLSVGSGIVSENISNNTLNLQSTNNITISGATTLGGVLDIDADNAVVFGDVITTNGNGARKLNISAKSISLDGITNSIDTTLNATDGTITSSDTINNIGTFVATTSGQIIFDDFSSNGTSASITSSGSSVTTGTFSVSNGTMAVSGTSFTVDSLLLTGGTTTITSADINVLNGGVANVKGGIAQGGTTGGLNLIGTSTFDAPSLTISDGGFVASAGNTTYTITNVANVGSGITIANGARSTFNAGSIVSGAVTNNGTLALISTNTAIETGDITNSGTLTLNSATTATTGGIINNAGLAITTNGLLTAKAFKNSDTGTANITSNNMLLTTGLLDARSGVLYQGYTGDLSAGDVNITNANYTVTTSGVYVGGINQVGNTALGLNTSDLKVKKVESGAGIVTQPGDIIANNLTVEATPAGNWLNVEVDGNVSGGVKIIGLEHMTIGGNYIYDDNSMLHVAVLPYGTGIAMNTTTYNYWADVSLADDNTLGQITNRDNNPETSALIYVGGRFASDISDAGESLDGTGLVSAQMGINLYDIVDQGSAIWLLYADGGLSDLNKKIRNLKVNFCNVDGSVCFNYFDAFTSGVMNSENNGTADDLPIYLSIRDYDNDGINDSLYIVFDPRFGGPVKVFDTESIVNRIDDSTEGEISGANALDNMVLGQLESMGFYNNTPIEAIPIVFQGTNLSELANELYDRMERYVVERDGTAMTNFARLIQPRELEQVAGSITLNEHTSFRDFEDRMYDEFIWNRHRNLNKVWFDADIGMFRQEVSDEKTLSGNRFNITAGFDWQNSKTAVVGLMARASYMSSDNSDSMDLGYMPGVSIDGHNSMTVSDTDIGVGLYFMKILGVKTRMYGNAMFDAHLFDISRKQNYVDDITGSGTAFSVISEWGLMHDWLNQYVVGNLYARFGYNFGFSITEKAAGDEYMNMESDGYFILTPGYSLIAQKRIYTSPWFQIRPYASVGIEYDVMGMPDVTKYKFTPAKTFTEYGIDIDPLWANAGAGIEMLSASGIQIGFDYRFQYNNYIQMHNLRLSGSIRF